MKKVTRKYRPAQEKRRRNGLRASPRVVTGRSKEAADRVAGPLFGFPNSRWFGRRFQLGVKANF